MLQLSNTMTGKKEPLSLPQKVTLYVCGITPYAPAHIGHGRCYISFDLLVRMLTFLGYSVTYCRNITDIDDKLLVQSHALYGTIERYQEVATHFFNSYKKQMVRLNIQEPTMEPRVTDHINEIIRFIETLIEKNYAYISEGDVYFSIDHCAQYGALSGQKKEQLLAGARVEVRTAKKNALDFVLWKKEEEPFWHSPWGNGRPGWHIECSALAATYLGETIHVHGGGLDLLFPHHENEKAQSEARFGTPFVRCWVHSGLVTVNSEKMSKSIGNYITLEDICNEYDPMVVRYYFLTFHYKAPAEFSAEGLRIAQKNYERIIEWATDPVPLGSYHEVYQKNALLQKMVDVLSDDLNTPAFFGLLFEHIKVIQAGTVAHAAVVHLLKEVIGLTLLPVEKKEQIITPEITQLLKEREAARAERNWQRADELRDQLMQKGYEVHDKKVK